MQQTFVLFNNFFDVLTWKLKGGDLKQTLKNCEQRIDLCNFNKSATKMLQKSLRSYKEKTTLEAGKDGTKDSKNAKIKKVRPKAGARRQKVIAKDNDDDDDDGADSDDDDDTATDD